MTSDAPIPPSASRVFTAFAAAVSIALLLGLSLFPPSTTRLQVWPWAAFAAAGWLLVIFTAIGRLALNRPHARFGGGLDTGLGLLAVAATASALISPLRGAVLPHLLPVLGMCSLPFALLPLLQPGTAVRTWRVSGLVLGAVLVTSLLLWLEPWTGVVHLGARNAQPFGHANITGSVAVLAATWLVAGAVRETGRPRLLFILGALLGVIVAVSSESRGAVLALAAAGTCASAILLLQRGRFLVFVTLALVLTAGAIASNARLRDLVVHGRWSDTARESNDQRTAMLMGGLRLGAKRPLLGWGAGAVPHVFPRVRGDLPGTADNVVQLHNTPTQLWATLGATGLLAGAFVIGGLLGRARGCVWSQERIALASGLVAAATVLLFDHPFSTPLFAALAAAHLAAWAKPADSGAARRSVPIAIALGGGLLLIPVVPASVHDLAARAVFNEALDHAAANDRNGYVGSLRRAMNIAPDDPYYAHLLAAHLVTGQPFPGAYSASPKEAIALLESTLARNSDLEYAHYNLAWLLLEADPAASAEHFLKSARLAPQRGAVYWGLGLARIRLDDTEGAARAFAAEWLLDPAVAWSPIWRQPPFAALSSRIRTLAEEAVSARHLESPWSEPRTPVTLSAPYRRLRSGYGVLMGHPEGTPPMDFNIQAKVVLPPDLRARVPAFGWTPGHVLLDFLNSPAP